MTPPRGEMVKGAFPKECLVGGPGELKAIKLSWSAFRYSNSIHCH